MEPPNEIIENCFERMALGRMALLVQDFRHGTEET
jgi:hypothetical protein